MICSIIYVLCYNWVCGPCANARALGHVVVNKAVVELVVSGIKTRIHFKQGVLVLRLRAGEERVYVLVCGKAAYEKTQHKYNCGQDPVWSPELFNRMRHANNRRRAGYLSVFVQKLGENPAGNMTAVIF